MPISFNGSTMKNVVFNGSPMNIVNFNGKQVWNRELRIYDYGKEGVSLSSWASNFDAWPIEHNNGSVTKNSNNISIVSGCAYSNSPGVSGIYTSSKIDLSPYSTLTAVVSGYAANNDNAFACDSENHAIIGLSNGSGIGSRVPGDACNQGYKDLNTGTNNNRTVTWDISNKNGSYNIVVSVCGYRLYHASNVVTVHSIILT